MLCVRKRNAVAPAPGRRREQTKHATNLTAGRSARTRSTRNACAAGSLAAATCLNRARRRSRFY